MQPLQPTLQECTLTKTTSELTYQGENLQMWGVPSILCNTKRVRVSHDIA